MTHDLVRSDEKAVSRTRSQGERNWQRQHYEAAAKAYGSKAFTRPDSPYTKWILDRIASVSPHARAVAELGAGTCVFSSLLGRKLRLQTDVVCYEPVEEFLAEAAAFDNVEAVCGDAVDFARSLRSETFDLVFTKDAAHHFAAETLDEVHAGICRKLNPGGRYLMVLRKPPATKSVPVGSIARARWQRLYTPLSELLASMRRVRGWTEIGVTEWHFAAPTSVREWIDGVGNHDSWSIFSALNAREIAVTVRELEEQFAGMESFDFPHQYDVAIFEKSAAGTVA